MSIAISIAVAGVVVVVASASASALAGDGRSGEASAGGGRWPFSAAAAAAAALDEVIAGRWRQARSSRVGWRCCVVLRTEGLCGVAVVTVGMFLSSNLADRNLKKL